MDNQEQLKKLGRIFNSDKIVTNDDLVAVLKGVLEIMNSFKKDNQNLSAETKQTVTDLLTKVEEYHTNSINTLSSEKKAMVGEFTAQVAILKAMVAKVKTIKPKDGIDGVNPNPEDVVPLVLAKIELPKYKETILDDRQKIVDKINTGKKDDIKIESRQIDGIDKLATTANLDRAIGILDQRTQFLINKTTSTGVALKTNGTANGLQSILNLKNGSNITITDDGAGGVTITSTGGSAAAGGSNTQVQYNNAGALAGITGATTDGTKLTLVTPVLGAATYTTLSGGNITDSALTAGRITFAGTAGLLSDSANLTYAAVGGLTVNNIYSRFGTTVPPLAVANGVDVYCTDNTIGGVQVGVGNASNGIHAYSFLYMNNDLAVSADSTHYAGLGYTSSLYNDITFGTAANIANQLQIWNTDGAVTTIIPKTTTIGFANWIIGGVTTTNEVFRITNAGATVGLTGTLTGAIKFAGATSTQITLQGQAVGSSGVLTLPAATDTLVGKATTDVFTNKTMIATTNVVEEMTTISSSATPTPTGGSLRNFFSVTALAAGATFAAPSGTPQDNNVLTIRIKDNGTAQSLVFNAIYRASTDLALPTTTTISKTMYLNFRYNGADSKWDFVAQTNGF